MSEFDLAWATAVGRECDPIFEAAAVGFERQVLADGSSSEVRALLWEADPGMFAARYPDSGIVHLYGAEQWPDVRCIDWWAYIDPSNRQARLSVEGWNLPELWLTLSGVGVADGCMLADVFARLLAVPISRARAD